MHHPSGPVQPYGAQLGDPPGCRLAFQLFQSRTVPWLATVWLALTLGATVGLAMAVRPWFGAAINHHRRVDLRDGSSSRRGVTGSVRTGCVGAPGYRSASTKERGPHANGGPLGSHYDAPPPHEEDP